jgi:hypothetical protein
MAFLGRRGDGNGKAGEETQGPNASPHRSSSLTRAVLALS